MIVQQGQAVDDEAERCSRHFGHCRPLQRLPGDRKAEWKAARGAGLGSSKHRVRARHLDKCS